MFYDYFGAVVHSSVFDDDFGGLEAVSYSVAKVSVFQAITVP